MESPNQKLCNRLYLLSTTHLHNLKCSYIVIVSCRTWIGNRSRRSARAMPQGSPQLVQQRLRLLKVGRVEAFGEPAVDRHEDIAGFGAPALVVPKAREVGGGAQFPPLGALLLSGGYRLAKACISKIQVRDRFQQSEVRFKPLQLRFGPLHTRLPH